MWRRDDAHESKPPTGQGEDSTSRPFTPGTSELPTVRARMSNPAGRFADPTPDGVDDTVSLAPRPGPGASPSPRAFDRGAGPATSHVPVQRRPVTGRGGWPQDGDSSAIAPQEVDRSWQSAGEPWQAEARQQPQGGSWVPERGLAQPQGDSWVPERELSQPPRNPAGGAPFTGTVPMVASPPVEDVSTGFAARPSVAVAGPVAEQSSPVPDAFRNPNSRRPLEVPTVENTDDDKPSKGFLVPVLVGVVALLAGLGAVYLWNQRQGTDAQPLAIADTDTDTVDPAGASTSDGTADGVEPIEPQSTDGASAAPSEPTLFFPAADGPLERFTTYEIELAAAPENTLLHVVVDGMPQETPAESLPNLILPEGRHTIEIAILDAETQTETQRSNPVEIYVFGAEPEVGYTANLSSISIADEGWEEAIRRYDAFRSAGHEGAVLLPLVEGYWNILVPGFGTDVKAVEDYCGSFELAFPDQCFARVYNAGDYVPTRSPDAGGSADVEGGADQAPADTDAANMQSQESGDGSTSDAEADGG